MIPLKVIFFDTRRFCPDIPSTVFSPSVQARLAQFGDAMRRRQRLLGRWLMAQAADCDPVMVEEGADYPFYAGRPDWQASISHSGPYLAAVFSGQGRFGLDIEFPQRPRDWPALARRAFSPKEADWVAAASGSEQCERFQRIWTLREAAYKSGELAHVVGNQPIFNPLTNQAHGDFLWQYLRQGELHLSVVGRDNFSLAVHQISD